MVDRKAQAKQSTSDEPEITPGETIIDAELETAKSGQRFSRSEIIMVAALGLSLAAIALALWPVFTARLTTEKQQELGQRFETLICGGGKPDHRPYRVSTNGD